MKRTKIIKKSDVIQALKKERLKTGDWFKPSYSRSGNEIIRKNCDVCAIGAILRKMSFEAWGRKNGLDLNIMGEEAVNFGPNDYLGSLSDTFENGASKKECIQFVKRTFPRQFELTIEMEKGD